MNKNKFIKLEEIVNDSISGSSEILKSINQFIIDNIKSGEDLAEAISILKNKTYLFASLQNYVDLLIPFSANKDFLGAIKFTKSHLENLQNKYRTIFTNATQILNSANSVLTISNSFTLLQVFKIWKNYGGNFQVIISESRPKDEGKVFAKSLIDCGIKVNFVTDASLNICVPEVDAIIIGADRILSNGNVINKTGSGFLALSAKYYNKPFYVFADKTKFVEADKFENKIYSPKDIWNYQNKLLQIENYLFEEIPAELITKIITD